MQPNSKIYDFPLTIKVLGCSGGQAPQTLTTSFLIHHQIAIDAGALCLNLSLEEQRKLKCVLITHTHIDHIKDLAFLADNRVSQTQEPLLVYGSEKTIDGIKRHLFNDVLWPDFTKIPTVDSPSIILKEIPAHGGIFDLGNGFKARGIPVNHIPGATGYIISTAHSSVVFTGDTNETSEIWKVAKQTPYLRAVFTEISFPSHLRALADLSHHFCPQSLELELKKIAGLDIPIYVSHFKPGYEEELAAEIKDRNLALKGVQILKPGLEFKF